MINPNEHQWDEATSIWSKGAVLRDIRIGGSALFIGTLLFVGSIIAEFSVGWSTPGSNFGLEEKVAIYRSFWPVLRWLWVVQMIGAFLMTTSALLLLTAPLPPRRFPPEKFLLAAIAVGGVMLTMAFGTAIGAYPIAFRSFETSPEIFATFLGEVGVTYRGSAAIVVFGYFIFCIQEGVAKDGLVSPLALVAVLVLIATAVGLAATGVMLAKTAGVVVFAAPALLGLSLWRGKRRVGSTDAL